MAFKHDLEGLTAAEIIAKLGCPRGTAYDWLDGRREPPAWQQPHWLGILRTRGGEPQAEGGDGRRKQGGHRRK